MAIGVPRPLAIEKPQAVDLVQAARYFGAHGEPDAATLALLQKCAVPLLAAAMPRAVWLLADTPALTEAGLLPGEDVHKHLAGCGQAILLAVTLGPGVDAQIRRAGVGVDDAAARRSVLPMDALDERRVGDVQLFRACAQLEPGSLQHGAHAAVQQDGIALSEKFIHLHRSFPSFCIRSGCAARNGRTRPVFPLPGGR